MSRRCNCRASSTGLICKKKFSFIINNKQFCTTHAKIEYNQYALRIQKVWNGKKIRNKLENIVYKLPDELQRKIVFYVRESYLLEKHHYRIIRNIITNKVQEDVINNILNTMRSNTREIELYEVNKISNIYYLFNKYHQIVPLDKIWFLRNNVFYLKNINLFLERSDSVDYYTKTFKQLRCNVQKFQIMYCQNDIRYHNSRYY